MDSNKLKSIIESILFVSGEPIKVKKIATIAKLSGGEIKRGIEILKQDFVSANRGIRIIEKDNEIQLATNSENAEYINDFLKNEMEQGLTRSSLETLAIVAYRGPLTRIEVEQVRGVNCTFTLRYLLLRGLIDRIENPNDSRSWHYKISFDFLKKLNFARIEDLPRYEELKKEAEKVKPT
ncbi:SMC-Scp complex subunit ScpB [Patescibacteria group bacterium]|nr:SMC-Scp complex subunit ScpB [Patescibacteria group bacterium]MBU4338908.1 SMC-Scp complex subunit ScpB [Patescibacteria group bacterium]MBU4579553.1 SMC-Scp complex subunit ScpB [Patescibacteria group bacterium]